MLALVTLGDTCVCVCLLGGGSKSHHHHHRRRGHFQDVVWLHGPKKMSLDSR